MMAQNVPHQTKDKRRVKVYELRNNDWFDRGTGFCTAAFTPVCFVGACRGRRMRRAIQAAPLRRQAPDTLIALPAAAHHRASTRTRELS